MAPDRYVKGVLTVIAFALIYLSVVLTPWPRAAAQAQTQPPLVRPGDPTGPMPVVVVGWRTGAGEVVPVAVTNAVTTSVQNTVQVSGSVTTERSGGAADRVVLVGWEERSEPARSSKEFRPFDVTTPRPGLPTSATPR
jgi:hypothetical protein